MKLPLNYVVVLAYVSHVRLALSTFSVTYIMPLNTSTAGLVECVYKHDWTRRRLGCSRRQSHTVTKQLLDSASLHLLFIAALTWSYAGNLQTGSTSIHLSLSVSKSLSRHRFFQTQTHTLSSYLSLVFYQSIYSVSLSNAPLSLPFSHSHSKYQKLK